MRLFKTGLLITALALSACAMPPTIAPIAEKPFTPRAITPVAEHGALSVVGPHILDQSGAKTSDGDRRSITRLAQWRPSRKIGMRALFVLRWARRKRVAIWKIQKEIKWALCNS